MSDSVLTELDLTNNEQLQYTLQFLELHLPYSRLSWQLLIYFEQKRITQNDIYPQLFVNNPNDIKCVILFYSTPGLSDASVIENYNRNIAVICEEGEDVDDILTKMLEKCVPWTRKVVFCGITQSYVRSSIEKVILLKSYGRYRTEDFHQIEIDQQTFQKTNPIVPPLPDEFEIRPLSIEEAPIIFDFWYIKSDDFYSVAQVRFCIENLLSLGAYHNGQLVSWRILQYDGSNEMLFTLPEARRLGLAYQLSVRMAPQVLKLQQRAFSYVALDNIASLATEMKVGYRLACTSSWIFYQCNSIENEKSIAHN